MRGSCCRADLGIGVSWMALRMGDHGLVYCVRRAGETGRRDRNEALALARLWEEIQVEKKTQTQKRRLSL